MNRFDIFLNSYLNHVIFVVLAIDNRITSLSKPELIALLLYVPGSSGKIAEPIRGKTRLMKILFLLFHEARISELKKIKDSFIAFRFGPFDSEIYDSLEALKTLGIVVEDDASEPSQEDSQLEMRTDDETVFRLTEKGVTRLQQFAERITPELYRTISNYKAIYCNKSLTQILQYVYSKFPEFATRSEARF